MTPQSVLAQPLTLACGAVLKNRLVKSAMSEALAMKPGHASPELARLYEVWAQGGIGLCITGNVMIDHRALGEPGNVVIGGCLSCSNGPRLRRPTTRIVGCS